MASESIFPSSDEINSAVEGTSERIDFNLASVFGAKSSVLGDGWNLLQRVFYFHFRPSQTLTPFGPMSTGDGMRSMIPDDLSNEQLDDLAASLSRVIDSEYRARIADVLWLRRKDATMGRVAVQAYLESGIALEDPENWVVSMERYERAIRLARQIDPKGELPRSILRHVENRVLHYDGRDPSFLTNKALELLAEFRFGDFPRLAEVAGRVAGGSRMAGDFRRARFYYFAQAKHLKLSKDADGAEAARVSAARTFVEEAESREAANEFMVAHSFWGEAIAAYRDRASLRRDIPNLQKRYATAGIKLRDEMHQFSSDVVDVTKFIEASRAAVRDLPWEDAFFELISHVQLINPTDLRATVEKGIAEHPIQATFAANLFDASGRKVGVRPSAFSDDQGQYEKAITGFMEQDARLRRSLKIHASIAPALRQIIDDHEIDSEKLDAVIGDSAFIPEERRPLFYQAFEAGFRWDFSTALHILVPQVENALRWVLEQHDVSPVNIDAEGVEEVWGYERILGHPKILETLGSDFVFELRSILVERLGPNLRNLFAHGALSPDAFAGEVAVYLWWVILRLAAFPTSGMQAFVDRKKAAVRTQ